jgi:hypothetical protein
MTQQQKNKPTTDVGSLYVNERYAWLVLHQKEHETKKCLWTVTYAVWIIDRGRHVAAFRSFDTNTPVRREDGRFDWDVHEVHVSGQKKKKTT